MSLRLAFLLTLSLVLGCGGSSNSISFNLNPSSATIQPNASLGINAMDINSSNQVDISWTIQEAAAAGANCTRTPMTSPPPPIPPGCEAFGVINLPSVFKGAEFSVTYVAPNRTGTFHIQCDVNSVAGTGSTVATGQQVATITVQ